MQDKYMDAKNRRRQYLPQSRADIQIEAMVDETKHKRTQFEQCTVLRTINRDIYYFLFPQNITYILICITAWPPKNQVSFGGIKI